MVLGIDQSENSFSSLRRFSKEIKLFVQILENWKEKIFTHRLPNFLDDSDIVGLNGLSYHFVVKNWTPDLLLVSPIFNWVSIRDFEFSTDYFSLKMR